MAGPLLIAGIQAAGQLLGSAINAGVTGNMNRRTRAFAREMYSRQRTDALADWNMQNAYNAPTAQMERLKVAGLNPNLVYGDGAAYTAQAVRSSSAPGWNPETPRWGDMVTGAGDVLSRYYDLQLRQAQIDNVKSATEVAKVDAALRAAQTIGAQVGAERAKFDLGLQTDLRATSLEAARESLRKLSAEADVVLRRDEREAAMNASNLGEAVERILSMRAVRAKTDDERDEIRARIRSISKDLQLKQLDINLKKMGVQPGDELWQRALAQFLGNGDGMSGTMKRLVPDNWWKSSDRRRYDSTMAETYKSGWQRFLESRRK